MSVHIDFHEPLTKTSVTRFADSQFVSLTLSGEGFETVTYLHSREETVAAARFLMDAAGELFGAAEIFKKEETK